MSCTLYMYIMHILDGDLDDVDYEQSSCLLLDCSGRFGQRPYIRETMH